MPRGQDLTEKGPAFRLDQGFYDAVRAAKPRYRLIERFTIPPYSGQGFMVRRGQTFRVVEETGSQIGDVAFWNAHDPATAPSGVRIVNR